LALLEKNLLFSHTSSYITTPGFGVRETWSRPRVEPYGESGKYKLIFSEKAQPVGPIPYGDAPSGAMQGPRYTTFEKLKVAKTLTDVLSLES